MKQVCKIRDIAFSHVPSSAGYDDSQYIEWDRNSPVLPNDTIFFTDTEILKVHNIEYVKCKKKIAWLLESPAVIPNIYEWMCNGGYMYFDHVLTHKQNWVDEYPEKMKWVPVSSIWTPKTECGLHLKSKLLSAIVSDKKWFIGHKFRHFCCESYRDKIDLYGTGFNRPIKTKSEALNDYRFNLCILNHKSDGYFTDILGDAISNGCIPIYFGGDLSRYFNMDGIITFNNVEELGQIIDKLTPELYNSKLDAIKDNMERIEKYRVAEDYMWKNLPEIFQ